MYAKSYYNAKYENKSCFFNSFPKKKKKRIRTWPKNRFNNNLKTRKFSKYLKIFNFTSQHGVERSKRANKKKEAKKRERAAYISGSLNTDRVNPLHMSWAHCTSLLPSDCLFAASLVLVS